MSEACHCDWEDERAEEQLDRNIVAKEVQKQGNKFKRYTIAILGDMPEKNKNSISRIIYCQLNNAPAKGMCQVKMGCVQKLNEKEDVYVDLFAALGYNFKTSRENLTTWFENQKSRVRVTNPS